MKKLHVLILIFTLSSLAVKAQNNSADELAFTQTLSKRADKILGDIALTDSLKYKKARDLMVAQYKNLNAIHEEKATQLKAEKGKTGIDKSTHEANLKSIEDAATNRLAVLHSEYISQLSSVLEKNQVEKIKDGMTYGVLPVTVKAYNDMIPSLKDAEKQKILTWLTEARELAMDAGSSDAKHQVFGKYKGRINNYLSAQGYDLQAERKGWETRLKSTKTN